MKNRIIWGIFILLSFIILVLDAPLNLKYGTNVIKELKELLKLHSKYTEDGDWHLIHKTQLHNIFRKRKK